MGNNVLRAATALVAVLALATPALAEGTADKWLEKVASKLYKDQTGKELPDAARENPEKAWKEFKKEHLVHEGGTGPQGSLIFFKDRFAVSNGDGTMIAADAKGGVDPRTKVTGDPLGYAEKSSGGSSGTSDAGTTGPSGSNAAASAATGGSSGATASGSGESFSGGSSAKIPDKLKEIIKRALKADGLPESWADSPGLAEILSHESSFSSTAQNPTSTAYGLFQFLDSTWATVGAKKTSDPYLQCVAGLKYIHDRYGNPDKAWAFWSAHHWY